MELKGNPTRLQGTRTRSQRFLTGLEKHSLLARYTIKNRSLTFINNERTGRHPDGIFINPIYVIPMV